MMCFAIVGIISRSISLFSVFRIELERRQQFDSGRAGSSPSFAVGLLSCLAGSVLSCTHSGWRVTQLPSLFAHRNTGHACVLAPSEGLSRIVSEAAALWQNSACRISQRRTDGCHAEDKGEQTVRPVGIARPPGLASARKNKFLLLLFLFAGSFTRYGALSNFCRLAKGAWTSVSQRSSASPARSHCVGRGVEFHSDRPQLVSPNAHHC